MKEFEGELKSIFPNKLIEKSKNNDFDNFFLVLGLIFNDFKDIILFNELIHETYLKPKLDGSEPPSVHLGHWGGIQNHLNRLMVGLISEFLIFLDKNKKTINSISFKLFVKNLPHDVRQDWNKIQNVLQDSDSKDFLSKIAEIRSNVTFHYDQSLTQLRIGFIEKFITSTKNNYNKQAFYSLGNTIQTTRFYYSDGAAEEYVKKEMKYLSNENYNKEMRELVDKTNTTIRFMMEHYLKQKIKK
ncbi:MAG: hypothetical protein WC671_00020 [Candidatus Paceibacterota bacterium]